jgi:sortase B
MKRDRKERDSFPREQDWETEEDLYQGEEAEDDFFEDSEWPEEEEYEEEYPEEEGDYAVEYPEEGYEDIPREEYEGYDDDPGNDIRRRGRERQPERSERRRFGFGWIIPAALAVVCAFSGFKVAQQLWVYQQAKNEYSNLDSLMGLWEDASLQTEETETDAQAEESAYPILNIDYDALKEINSEFAGVIYIPVLGVKYPVAQASDNTKYLRTTFEGTANSSGCIFLDCAVSSDFSDINSFVFGHNMKNETMFGSLKKFLQDESLCDENPYIYIYQENQVLIYRIFAYYTIPVEDDVYNDFAGDEAYDAYVSDAISHSAYKLSDEGSEEISWSDRPRLITLSTCYATGHVYNFVVQGALVDVESPAQTN